MCDVIISFFLIYSDSFLLAKNRWLPRIAELSLWLLSLYTLIFALLTDRDGKLISSIETLPAAKSYLKFMGDEALEYFLTTPHKGKWTTIVQSLNDVTAEALLSFMSYRGGIKSRDLGLAIHNKSHPKLEEAGVDNFGAFLPQQRHTACKSRHRPWGGLKREDLVAVYSPVPNNVWNYVNCVYLSPWVDCWVFGMMVELFC